MKRFILFSALLFAVFSVPAQQPDAGQVIVHYKFIHLRNTDDPTHPFIQEMILVAGKRASVYRAQPKRGAASAAPPDMPKPKFGTEYYFFAGQNKMTRIEGLFNAYRIDEVLPVQNWKVTGDTATKGGLKCQKATTHFKGRDYTAWFCPSLPIHAGPWKLSGLPGLILEAYDSKREVQFLFAGLDKTAETISLPTDAIKTTDAGFERFRETSRKDPGAFSKALTMQNGGVPGKSGPQIDMRPAPAPVINNPIELPEKK